MIVFDVIIMLVKFLFAGIKFVVVGIIEGIISIISLIISLFTKNKKGGVKW